MGLDRGKLDIHWFIWNWLTSNITCTTATATAAAAYAYANWYNICATSKYP